MTHPLWRAIVLLALGALVAACATTPEQQAQRDDQQCTARGYQPNSKTHDECVISLQSRRDARTQQRHRELIDKPATPYSR